MDEKTKEKIRQKTKEIVKQFSFSADCGIHIDDENISILIFEPYININELVQFSEQMGIDTKNTLVTKFENRLIIVLKHNNEK